MGCGGVNFNINFNVSVSTIFMRRIQHIISTRRRERWGGASGPVMIVSVFTIAEGRREIAPRLRSRLRARSGEVYNDQPQKLFHSVGHTEPARTRPKLTDNCNCKLHLYKKG